MSGAHSGGQVTKFNLRWHKRSSDKIFYPAQFKNCPSLDFDRKGLHLDAFKDPLPPLSQEEGASPSHKANRAPVDPFLHSHCCLPTCPRQGSGGVGQETLFEVDSNNILLPRRQDPLKNRGAPAPLPSIHL